MKKFLLLLVSICMLCTDTVVYAQTWEEAWAQFTYVEGLDTDKGSIVEMDASNIDVPFTLELAVCPVLRGTKDGTEVNAYSGKMKDLFPDSGMTAVRKGRDIAVYDENGKVAKTYDLRGEQVYMKPNDSPVPLYEGKGDTVTDGWVDVNGDFVDLFAPYEEDKPLYLYCTGIGMNIYDNLDKFDDIWFTDSGIMVIRITQTLREYNVRQFGMEKPAVFQYTGELARVKKIFREDTDPAEMKRDPYAVEWYTPRGELILKSEGAWGKTYYTRLYGEIMGGRYRHNDHKTLDDTSPALEPSDVLVMDSDGSGTLYIGSDGTFAGGWKTIAGSKYYFKKDGYAATGRATIGGVRYTFDESGVCRGRYSGWTKSSKGYRYYYKGKMLKGYYRIGGTSYYFNEKGYAVRRTAS
ncbi:MAG: hypothetical protein II714_03015 [Oscillospiraceae bacterium]|nr:hypothetical protein [Oscillospiraceae bacterium]